MLLFFILGAQNQRNKDIKIQQQQMIRPAFYLNSQQLQTLHYLQQLNGNLNPQQQALLAQLQHQFRLMQQHQHQQRQQQVCLLQSKLLFQPSRLSVHMFVHSCVRSSVTKFH